ncbi:hypothetical protein KGA66_14240 [Actinocrinis puniceicyclus]|uniref:Uncharacterized protein n=1 Tax=Actinocrinis puniceicyclus TaxID=977794 RepID=A0A8J7WRG7_9ACTN|nr:hypothetical protein [Actinocrinis puniceicyclus]MBS2964215.1 hypothetical protein [Actinocrinis puniceicyclus]
MNAPQLDPRVPLSDPGPETAPTATPLYDALVLEYRLAQRCVPGDRGADPRAAVRAASALPAAAGFPHASGALAHARPAVAVPRQVSRHRGTSRDASASDEPPR